MRSKYACLFLSLCILLDSTRSAITTQCGTDNDVVVTETIVDNKITQFEWIGTTGTAFALTQSYTLYRSTDEGRTWTIQNPMMAGSDTVMPPQNRKGIQTIVKTVASNDTVYFLGWGGQFWSTQNRGDSYTSTPVGANLLTLLPHPTDPNWLLADSKTSKCYDSTASGTCFIRLHLTQNRGASWRVIDTYISPNTQYTWANAGLNSVPKETIWVLDWESKTGDYNSKSIFDLRLLHSVDFLSSVISHPVDNIVFMLFHGHNIYLAQQESSTSLTRLLISEDDGNTFNYANFPTKYAEQQYQILDDSEGSVFINVRHGSQYWGTLYHSNVAGSNYTLSMTYNKRDTTHNYRAEFSRLEGIDGIYIANSLDNVPSGSNSNGDARTKISFDKGGEWQYLSLPYDRTGTVQETCTATNCQLHLHGISKKAAGTYNADTFGPLYSNSKAIGLMLGTGNVGQYMSSSVTNANVYLTRDAGWTWYHILDGSHIYEFSDFGALMLFANNVNPIDTVKYTWDQGLSLVDCKFTNNGAVEVLNIVAEPTTTAQSFVLHGYRSPTEVNTTGVIAHFDFTNLHETQCIDTDYEVFVPYDSTNSSTQCLLGQTTTYTRRKRDSACFNGREFQPQTNSQPCACTREDYECDTCYEPVGSVCSLVADCAIDVSPPKDCDGYYYVSRGYRLIDGDKCDPKTGLDLTPVAVSCGKQSDSGNGSGGTSGGIVALIVILALLLVVVLGVSLIYVYRNHDLVQKYVPAPALDLLNTIGQRRQDYSQFLVDESTALDEDLLTEKIADPIDDVDDSRNDSFI